MKYCGLELKGSEVILVSIEISNGEYRYLSPEMKKIKFNDSGNQSDVKTFLTAIEKFFAKHHFDKIGIKGRQTRGKFAGGPTSFKMEGIIQTMNFPVEIISAPTIRAKLKDQSIDTSGINSYQIEALKVALCLGGWKLF